jgi:hypothetical protein
VCPSNHVSDHVSDPMHPPTGCKQRRCGCKHCSSHRSLLLQSIFCGCQHKRRVPFQLISCGPPIRLLLHARIRVCKLALCHVEPLCYSHQTHALRRSHTTPTNAHVNALTFANTHDTLVFTNTHVDALTFTNTDTGIRHSMKTAIRSIPKRWRTFAKSATLYSV